MVSGEQKRRLIQLLGMLGSHHDGEVLNAAKLAQRQLGATGLTWEELINGPAPEDHDPEAFAQAFEAGYQEGLKQGYKKGYAAAEQALADQRSATSWPAFAQLLLDEYNAGLNQWELGFVETFIEKGWDEPTPRQQGVFERIARKFGLECPD